MTEPAAAHRKAEAFPGRLRSASPARLGSCKSGGNDALDLRGRSCVTRDRIPCLIAFWGCWVGLTTIINKADFALVDPGKVCDRQVRRRMNLG